MGRRDDIRGLNDRDRQLVELEDSVRVLYLTNALFHARVQAGGQVLGQLFPDLNYLDARRAALLVLAAAQLPKD